MSKTPLTYWEIARSGAGAKRLFGESGQRGFLVPEDYNYVSIGDRSCRINMYSECMETYITYGRRIVGTTEQGEYKPFWPYVPVMTSVNHPTIWQVIQGSEAYVPLSNSLCRGAYIHSDSVRSVDRWMGFLPNVYNSGATVGAIDQLIGVSWSQEDPTPHPFTSAGKDIMVGSARTEDTPVYLVTNRRLEFNFWVPRSIDVYCQAQYYWRYNSGDEGIYTYNQIGYSPQMDVSAWGNLGPVSDSHTLRVFYSTIANAAKKQFDVVPDLNNYILSKCDLDLDYMFQVKLYRDIP